MQKVTNWFGREMEPPLSLTLTRLQPCALETLGSWWEHWVGSAAVQLMLLLYTTACCFFGTGATGVQQRSIPGVRQPASMLMLADLCAVRAVCCSAVFVPQHVRKLSSRAAGPHTDDHRRCDEAVFTLSTV